MIKDKESLETLKRLQSQLNVAVILVEAGDTVKMSPDEARKWRRKFDFIIGDFGITKLKFTP